MRDYRLDACGSAEPRLLNRLAWDMRWRSRERCVAFAQRVLDLPGPVDTPRRHAEGLARRALAWQAKWRGDFDTAHRLCDRALADLADSAAVEPRADLYSILGIVHLSRTRHDLARACVEAGLALIEDNAATETRIDLLTTLATSLRCAGNRLGSQSALFQALDLSDGVERARVLHNMARYATVDKRPAEALEHGREALALARAAEARVLIPYTLEVIGAALTHLDRHEDARAPLREGVQIGAEDGDRRIECQCLFYLAKVDRAAEALDLACAGAERGHRLAQSISYRLWEGYFLRLLAELYEAKGDIEAALNAWKALAVLRDAEQT